MPVVQDSAGAVARTILLRLATLLTQTLPGALISSVRSALFFLQRRSLLPALRTVLAHWLRERRTLRQGTIALTIGISITLVAGLILGAAESVLDDVPGLLVLTPSAIGMRGAIFGALGARLGTGMLTGQLEEGLSRRSFLGQNIEAASLLSLSTAVVLAAVARLAAAVTGLRTVSFTDLVLVSMISAVLSSLAIVAVVLLLTRTAQRLRWDMDAIGTPIISASADISTLPALLLATLALGNATVSGIVGWVIVAIATGAALLGVLNPGELARRITRESLPILAYTALMGILAGTVLEARKEVFITSAALLVAVPPFIAASGAIGGILSARLSSGLHLGLVEPLRIPDRPAWLEGSLTLLFAVLAYVGVGLATALAAGVLGYSSPGLGPLVAAILLAGLMAAVLVFTVGYYAATASYRFGLDPDNVGIPLVTSTMDFFGILCLAAGIALFVRG